MGIFFGARNIYRTRKELEMRDILIDFVLPAMIIVICFVLLMTGKNGEVKSILTLAAGWIFKSGIQRKRTP